MEFEVIKKNFLKIRQEKGLKWEDLASKAGVKSYQAIFSQLKGNITIKTLCALATLVEVEPYELLLSEHDQTSKAAKAAKEKHTHVIICPHCKRAVKLNIIATPQKPNLE